MSNRTLAFLAALVATTIYGLNHTIAKGLMPTYIKPFGLILVRVIGASILFWSISLFGPKEKIAVGHWKRIFICAFFGMGINMLAFFKGLSLSTPVNSSIIITVSPILVFLMSAFIVKEKITLIRYFGIALGFSGALALIFFSNETQLNAPNIPVGNMLFVVNSATYGLYLILVKPLTNKYHPFTIMKWLFLIGIFINFPIAISEFIEIEWSSLPFEAIWKICFVVVGTTFLTYLLNIYALKELKASTLSVFIYLQPIIGILYAIIIGADSLNSLKIITALFIFAGVYLVSKKPKLKV
ncbi:DMT family transporter [Yeosuana sp. MJ-SS3]|uniref:DMT family transporter n=1 Tax=Gilvirhabdus luticola TaxID=3079858 RepID=A0ABU3U377_9FLAO|nr:DMT family transporter [Yeosuana sp. MJ-SS3]MDU8884801.1 DMT family transporter [Yeosuana sp. MJ-SS3]